MRFIDKVRSTYKIVADSATDPYTKKVVNGYIDALLWSSSGSDQQGTEHESLQNFEESKELEDYALKTVKEFLAKAEKEGIELTKYKTDVIGHDLWLTQAGHGAGFWDGDYELDEAGEDGDKLTKIAKSFGEKWPYVGDDGLVYLD